ncbi:hypothetical protein Csa_006736 [Cucumis sativus]|uniref:Uncharacterized protein n=1 Tax=Cucumis sativus TaxID=3659 RepID=A0A0A0LHH6_CUCSA|nr:hypothetical protein Csa_006736 [Cucumis sativus]
MGFSLTSVTQVTFGYPTMFCYIHILNLGVTLHQHLIVIFSSFPQRALQRHTLELSHNNLTLRPGILPPAKI